MSPLILASRSPTRARLLRDAGLEIELRASAFDEAAAKHAALDEGLGAREIAERLAQGKALAVADADARLVLGADQTLELDGVLFDKPRDLDDLRDQLNRLRGRTHWLHSAAALVRDGAGVWADVASVRMVMRRLCEPEIDRYVAEEGAEALGCVGGYRLEARGVQLFDAVEGDYFAVLGLPLLSVLRALRELGEGP